MASEEDILTRYRVPRHRLTVRDYHRMADAGILGRDDRVELFDGQIVVKPRISPRHAVFTDTLARTLIQTFAGRAGVRIKCPVVLDDFSEPEPDGALLRPPRERYRDAHPRPDDVFLLIELSDATLAADRGVKLELYARAGVREVWIVDLTTNTVLVHRDPAGAAYRSVVRVDASGVLEVEALPGPTIPVSALFF